MLKLLVRIASSRWTKIAVLLLWLISLLSMINRGWINESWEMLPGEGALQRSNYFDVRRNYLFVWLTLIVVAYLAHIFKQRSLGYYGLVEMLFGIVAGYIALAQLSLDQATSWLTVLASAYVVVRGAGNISQAVREEAG
jgi:hypothetical protein